MDGWIFFFFSRDLEFRRRLTLRQVSSSGVIIISGEKPLGKFTVEAGKKPVNQAAQVPAFDPQCLRKSVTCISRRSFILREKPGIVQSRATRCLCACPAFASWHRLDNGMLSAKPGPRGTGEGGGGVVPLGPWADYGGGVRAVAKSGRRRPRCLRHDLPSCPSTGEAPAGDERPPPAQQPGTADEPQPAPRRLRGKRIGSRKHVSK